MDSEELKTNEEVITGRDSIRERVVRGSYGDELYHFLMSKGDLHANDTVVLSTSRAFNIAIQPLIHYRMIVNLHKMNDVRRLCRFFAGANKKLSQGGLLICCLETAAQRRRRILRKFPPGLNHLYYFGDYLLKRVFRDLHVTRWFYHFLFAGRNQVIDYYEAIGRLTYCGFKVEAEKSSGDLLYIVARKMGEAPEEPREQYGTLLAMNRIGQNGQVVKVYKFRTMVPFSEYVQGQLYEKNHLGKGGKFSNDRRITRMGAFLRKFWIDELPMVINLFKGEVKLVGVRPLSPQYLSLYEPAVAERRVKVKPGLVPPFYADLPQSLKEIQQSELKYIEQWENAPFKTDVRYFFKAAWNILIRGARSH